MNKPNESEEGARLIMWEGCLGALKGRERDRFFDSPGNHTAN